MNVDAKRMIAVEIRDELTRNADVFVTHPDSVRETLLARGAAGRSAEVEAYHHQLCGDLIKRSALVPRAGCLRRESGLLRILRGHSGRVTHVVAISGERALSASEDKTLRLWDLASGETLRVLEGHSDQVTHVVALPGERALSASRDNTLRLWDLAKSSEIARFTTDAALTTVAMATSGSLGAVGDQKGRVLIFRLSKSCVPT
jgi:WD40 repeat protein